ncbi:MAG: DUF1501 domain-containing protein [Roseibacillus sp.]|jgi:hypothetical protein|nr:DUF1501 domain-containing protein [Roseibacillus sp.]MDP7655719.1 DUF1501 domain-containing protein [Roseibacillus sp.]HJM63953.1 DUF1501 domain-containing protein [Roseibacillus sp.]|tara:strand:+ start:2844 stop:4241 length:1398 start_codon:yes stop_codon:yes gene_type:complete
MMNRPASSFHFSCGRTRREFLWQAGNGFFGTAMAWMLARDGARAGGITPSAHFPARAKHCIFLFMVGGPSHIDTFDPKPVLNKRHGEDYDFKPAQGVSQKGKGKLMGSPFKFQACGQSGIEVSELFPHLREHIDEMAVIRGTKGDSAAHGAASLQMNTGFVRQGLPCLGSWANYGLGSPNNNMPGFVVLVNGAPYSGAQNWGAGFMPSGYQGTVLKTSGTPVPNLVPAMNRSRETQRDQLDLLARWNSEHQARLPANSELAARIEAYELAYRMQAHAPEAVDLSRESESTRKLYGIGGGDADRFGKSCLMARRLVERGTRFVQLYHSNWDTHGDNDKRHQKLCNQTDRPIAGLLADLKARGLLEETLVVWAGEFGRTPVGTGGRDHHAAGFSTWMAGGGIKGGTVQGATDEFGFHVTGGEAHVHDLHATILHLMGLNHEELTYFHSGRDFRLTDVFGKVLTDIVA